MLSSTSSPRFFLQFMQLSLRHPHTPHTWAHHSQDHLSPDSLSPIAQSSCKSTAVRLGKANPLGRCPRSQAPPCPSGILQIGSLRTPKDSLTWLLSHAGPLQGLRPCCLGPGSPAASWPTFSLGPLTASRRCGLGLGALSPGPSQHLRLSPLQPCCYCPGPLPLAWVPSATLDHGTSSRNPLRSLGSSRATPPHRFRP